jgi:hypothetical protein
MSETDSCPCGCMQQVLAGCSYAGGNERERETHRARVNRQRQSQDRRREAREAEAQGVLAEIGLDAQAPAHALARAVEGMAGRLQRLALIVGRDLEASDVDRQRQNERVLLAEHQSSLRALQERLDDSSLQRRELEQRLLEADVATSQAQRAAAESNDAREAAVQAREDADRALQTSTAYAAEQATRACSALAAAGQITERLAASEAARCGAEDARAAGEEALRQALSDLREQQLRTAQVLAGQAVQASTTLTAALALADRHAVRDRRAAVREVRASLIRDVDQLRAELAVARREQEAKPRPPTETAG